MTDLDIVNRELSAFGTSESRSLFRGENRLVMNWLRETWGKYADPLAARERDLVGEVVFDVAVDPRYWANGQRRSVRVSP